MASNPMVALLDTTAREGERFSTKFFELLDARETPASILPTTTLVWNGTPLAGPQAFGQMIAASPITKHEISGYDAQPFPNGDTNAINMLVNTSGRVQLGMNRSDAFAFSAQLVVRRIQPGAPLILQTMAYRLVHRPKQSTIQT